MHARMIQVTTKPGQLKEFVKTMLEKNLPSSSNSRDSSMPWL
jgi:hypothetical protein